MSGITTGVGLFSGIDTASLINQLLSVEARPRDLAQQRILQLQMQQSAYLDINSKLSALRTAAKSFRLDFLFDSMGATSTDEAVLAATASRTAVPGSYSFLVDRLVSSQQLLSRGFVDQDSTAVGASSFTFESALGRLDRDVALADLNDGEGIERGKIVITQGSSTATVDLSKAATVSEALEAINASGLDVTATVSGGKFVLSGGSDFTVANASGYTTASSLGIAGSSTSGTLSGSTVYEMSAGTTLAQLNDGNGVLIGTDVGEDRYDFTIEVDNGITPASVNVNLGSVWETVDDELTETAGAVSTVGGVIDRINSALAEAGLDGEVSASISGGRIVIADSMGRDITVTELNSTSTTAAQLGIAGAATGTLTGERVLAGLNTTLLSNLNGGDGVAGAGTISFTARDGTSFSVDVSGAATVDELIDLVNDDAANAGRISLSLNPVGNGLLVSDSTGGGSNLIVSGDTATSLGIATDAAGVAADSVTGTSLQHRYISMATRLDALNGGAGVGTGELRFTDGNGVSFKVDIGSDTTTVYDLVREVNAQAGAADANIEVRINDNGDGLIVAEKSGEPAGAAPIKVEDVSGSVAAGLKLAGEAAGPDADNYIDGSAEVVVEFEATDTLQDMADAINDAGGPARVTIINDGTGSNPYRLSFSATSTGAAGRFLLDDGGLGLNLSVLDEGQDSRVFYGSSDPATAVLLTSSANTLDSVIPGVSIDLKSASEDPVTVTVSRDTEKIITSIQGLVTAYNAVVDRIGFLTRYDAETETKGPLLGDSTLTNLRASLSRTVLAKPVGVDDSFERLTEVGFKVGEGGTLSLDTDKFRQALESDFQAVADLMAARDVIPPETETEIGDGITVRNNSGEEEFSRLGVVFMFEELADDYLDSVDGILTGKDKTFTTKIELQEKRIESFNELLEIKRQRLEAQFLAMERALASLQTQQSSLLSLSQNMG
ncbi:MAG TPA: flagellar filament capping protein FliD [Phycisphaerales bacterium]|nr:flagellar filament capping protein FliD [Phycisphaerales bacterium]